MWVYIRSEARWTVGFYGPDGQWHPDSNWTLKEQAAARTHYLNGGKREIPSSDPESSGVVAEVAPAGEPVEEKDRSCSNCSGQKECEPWYKEVHGFLCGSHRFTPVE